MVQNQRFVTGTIQNIVSGAATFLPNNKATLQLWQKPLPAPPVREVCYIYSMHFIKFPYVNLESACYEGE